MSGSGISWAICNTAPATHHSVFYRPDALPAAQPTVSKHWRSTTGILDWKIPVLLIPRVLFWNKCRKKLLLLLLHPFNGLFFTLTWVSQYQNGKTSLDLNETRDDGVFGRQWHQLDRQPHQHLITQLFSGRMLFLTPNQQRQNTVGTVREKKEGREVKRRTKMKQNG